MMYRTINQAYEIFKNEDSETAITLFLIRILCKNGLVRTIKSGTRTLVELNSIREFLNKGENINGDYNKEQFKECRII